MSLLNEAIALHRRGDISRAEELYEQILAENPRHFDALHLTGVAAIQRADLLKALNALSAAIGINPQSLDAFGNYVTALRLAEQFDEALKAVDRALVLRPDHAEHQTIRGEILIELNRFPEALMSFERARALDASLAAAHVGYGKVLRQLHRLPEAMLALRQALRLDPDSIDAHFWLANILHHSERHEEAQTGFEQVLQRDPRHFAAGWNKCLIRLTLGDFDSGWPQYEMRWRHRLLSRSARTFDKPLWLGAENLQGKTILLHTEQGFGDTIQFCRFVKQVAARGARVILGIHQKPLLPLLARLDGVHLVATRFSGLDFDYHCPLMSLPLALKTTLQSIPSQDSYLHPDRALVEKWKIRLGEKRGLRIGIAWSANPLSENFRQRSLPLAQLLERLSSLPAGTELISLQKEITAPDAEMLARYPGLRHFGEHLSDFSETAALCATLDLVISVDTSVAHLAGATGVPVWILLAFHADWRWFLARTDSPWYPGATLFRQPQPGDWGSVVGRISERLQTRYSLLAEP